MDGRRLAQAAQAAIGAFRGLAGALSVDHARDSIRRHEQARRFAAHHPDMAELDRDLDDRYEPPGP